MKKILTVCIAGLMVFAFTGITFALDDEDDIMKRHEKRMEKLQAANIDKSLKAKSAVKLEADNLGGDTKVYPEDKLEADNLGGDTKVYPEDKLEADNLGGDTRVKVEVDQRRAVEAQIELKGNGKNYTVSPQMADAPREVIPIQKKQ